MQNTVQNCWESIVLVDTECDARTDGRTDGYRLWQC